MLDRFEYGKVERISPEAPVPVFKPTHTRAMLGGVGNVAANLDALGCKVSLVARIGKDQDGELIRSLTANLDTDFHYYRQKGCPTTVKTRLIAGNNHLLRIDSENICPLEKYLSTLIIDNCIHQIASANVILLSDYAKGMLAPDLCQAIIRECKKCGKKVIVDPKGKDFTKYTGAYLIKPNLKELSETTGRNFDPSDADFLKQIENAAKSLAKKLKTTGILVTLSEHGMLYVPTNSTPAIHLPTHTREVFDVSGAGDTALSALGAAIGLGLDIKSAMLFANAASGVVVGKLGTATASLTEIAEELAEATHTFSQRKLVTAEQMADIAAELKQHGKRIGFTNGCFDCCHLGHLQSLNDARALCDVLVVGVNSDRWIHKHKGKDRPIQDEITRTTLLASLEFVNYVVVFNNETALPLVRKIRPDVIAKEGYALKDWPEGQFVKSIGGKAVALKRVDGYSTTSLATKMKLAK